MATRKLIVLIAALALAIAACGGGSDTGGSDEGPVVPGDSAAGAAVYKGTCKACHGSDLEGIDGLGSALAPSSFVSEMSEDDLAAFILVGRAKDDPENTTGIEMPAKGGNTSLSNQDIQDVSAYLKGEN